MNKNYFMIRTKDCLFAHLDFDKDCNKIKTKDHYIYCYHTYENGNEILLGMIPHNEILFIKNKITEED